MSDLVRHDAVDVRQAAHGDLPVIYDSPHSGTFYPDDFTHAVEPFVLHGGEDRFVDDLVIDAPDHDITLVRALFARTYIDPNREPTDLDPALLPEDWPETVEPGPHSQRGVGLIFRLIGNGVPIYDRRLSKDEVHHRIETYWKAYQGTLQARIDALHERFGTVWHVNWHSMQAVGNALSPDPGAKRADFVLGDLHGTSCDSAFTDFVATTLRDLGHSVAINDPYAGAYLVRRHGRPDEGRHSLQIEINRGLYMDQETLEAHDGLAKLRGTIAQFSARLGKWVRQR
jgi:N-formylglutamate deformylase